MNKYHHESVWQDQECPECGQLTWKKTNKPYGKCLECKNEQKVESYRKIRGTEHPDDRLMSWSEIAKALNLPHAASARWIYNKAIRKLRKAVQANPLIWRELYEPEPERPGWAKGSNYKQFPSLMKEYPVQTKRYERV